MFLSLLRWSKCLKQSVDVGKMQQDPFILIEIFNNSTVLCRFDSAASSSESEDSDGEERQKKKKDIKRKPERKHKEPAAKKSREVCCD